MRACFREPWSFPFVTTGSGADVGSFGDGFDPSERVGQPRTQVRRMPGRPVTACSRRSNPLTHPLSVWLLRPRAARLVVA